MAQLLVRNRSDATVATIKARAVRNGRSLEAEHRAILDEAARADPEEQAKAVWIERAPRSRDAFAGRVFSPSEDIVWDMRGER